MSLSSAIKRFASVHTEFNKTIEEALTKQTEIEISLDKNDITFNAREQHNSFEMTVIDHERAIDSYVKETTDYLIKLKTRLNSLVFINRLPIELLSRIILFTIPKGYFEGWRHYITYTSVCHHWRSVLIQTADFWTSIHLEIKMKPVNGFVHEILRRSKSAKLDIRIVVSTSSNTLYTSILEILAEESHRIHALWLEGKETDEIELIFRGKCFPSLMQVVYNDWGRNSGLGFIPIIITSDHLQTLDFKFWRHITLDAINQLFPILSRTSNLRLHFSTPETLQIVLKLLHNNTNIRNLQLRMHFIIPSDPLDSLGQIILPELQFLSCTEPYLLQAFRVPKLSSLDLLCHSPVVLNNSIREFHFATIKYLHILDRQDRLYSILGLKEPIHPKAVFSVKPENDFLDEVRFIEGVDNIVDGNGMLSDTWPPGFLRLESFDDEVFAQSVKGALFSLLPQLTGLLELCLASKVILEDKEFYVDQFLAQVPSLRKLIIPYGNGLTDFIRHLTTDTSLCPHLDYLSYTISHPSDSEQEEEELDPESLGELLTECVQKRRKTYDDALRYIALGNCPLLPDVWFIELQKLGTTVVVTESVTVRVDESDSPEPSDSEFSGGDF
ncbi:hypothetical protein Clacol_010080 [Clathrus columnatus]|uniref:F-box domain-containing protein n=1 Tax=Clathrus columnatus TaxID=1419009 RepID=A0AAV5APT8_9AGAM|nr:hypothetical protein Clacol_010080 [Clathrus columnatus]